MKKPPLSAMYRHPAKNSSWKEPYLCPMEEERLDKLLIQRKLVSTRVRAERIIRETGVKVNGKLITKTGKRFPINCTIEMIEEEIPWVSRGAIKLIEALDEWHPELQDKVILDIGASTGGFTQVVLSRGVKKVFCVDVGKFQLHEKVASDPRVVNLERTHVRELRPALIPEKIDGCLIDVSFISLTKVLPFIHSFIRPEGFVIALIKPQFEVGKEHVGKNGIVKNHRLYPEVIQRIKENASLSNLQYQAHIPSPILGGDGNKEFLMFLQKGA